MNEQKRNRVGLGKDKKIISLGFRPLSRFTLARALEEK